MTKKAFAVLTLVMVLLMVSTTVLAQPPMEVGGLWRYQPFIKVKVDGECVAPPAEPNDGPCIENHDDNTVMYTFENGEWSQGDFEDVLYFDGVSTEDGKVVIHSSGFWSFNAIVSFEGEVDGKSGILKMSVVGKAPDQFSDWKGQWVILSGTGELSNLHGQGTWWGPGAPAVGEWGDIYYSGKVKFAP